jgi:hypothetical protein
MDNPWKKGQFIVNPKMINEWGKGILTEDGSADGTIKVFFEEECRIVKLNINHLHPTEVKPGSSRQLLEHALLDTKTKKSDTEPFPSVIKHFLENFPNGFNGKMLKMYERDDKWERHQYSVEHLTQEKWKVLLDTENYQNLSTLVKNWYIKSEIKFLATFEIIKLSDALKLPEAQKLITTSLYNLLYGEAPISQRFNETAKLFSKYEISKWPILTFPLFIRYPEKFSFVKPTMIKSAAEVRGYDIQYSSDVNWTNYERILGFTSELFTRLNAYENPDLHPKDMIDVQSFMWCTFSGGWTKENILQVQQKLELI